jgi:hypothetical protein
MGLKKNFSIRQCGTLLKRACGNLAGQKRPWLSPCLVVCFFVVGAGLLLYFAVNTISNMVSEKPDIDLIDLERLLAERSIVLTEDQKTGVMPIIQQFPSIAKSLQ